MDSASGSIQPVFKIYNTVYDSGIRIYMQIDHIKSRDVPPGQCICSPTFTFGGSDWALHFFPQGLSPTNQGINSSMFLVNLKRRSVDIEYFFKVYARTSGMHALTAARRYTFSNNSSTSGGDFVPRDKLATDYCINGQITICCSMRRQSGREFQLPSSGNLQEHIETLWTLQDDFDITFEVGGEEVSAHKIILSARSPVFKAQFFGNMADSKLNRIQIEDVKVDVFRALISYIYTDKVAVDDVLLGDLFVAADRYFLDKLKILCEEDLATKLSTETLVSTLLLAHQHNGAFLKKKCFEFLLFDMENYVQVAFTGEYRRAMDDPTLNDEFREYMITKWNLRIPVDKRQRTE